MLFDTKTTENSIAFLTVIIIRKYNRKKTLFTILTNYVAPREEFVLRPL